MPDGNADVARLVCLLEHRLEPACHVLDWAPRERRRNRVGLPRVGALLRALAKIGRREDVERADCADGELVVALTPTCPSINKLDRSVVQEFVRAKLKDELLTYAKAHPYLIKDYKDGFYLFL